MLDVHRRDDVDACVEKLVDIVPALALLNELVVRLIGNDGVRELIDEGDLGTHLDNRINIQLTIGVAAVGHLSTIQHWQAFDELLRPLATVVFHQTNDYLVPTGVQIVPLAQHGARLTHARGEPQVDLQFSSLGHFLQTFTCHTLPNRRMLTVRLSERRSALRR